MSAFSKASRHSNTRKGTPLFVDAIMALVRMSDTGEPVTSDLAKAILMLVEELRDTTQRAEMSEAALEAELQTVATIRDKLAGWSSADPYDASRVLHDIAEIVTAFG